MIHKLQRKKLGWTLDWSKAHIIGPIMHQALNFTVWSHGKYLK